MGKLSSQPDPTIQHFSHPHPLHLTNHQPKQTLFLASCSGCKLTASGWIYQCQACNYFLHVKCSQMPNQIKHPFHQNHVFSLLPTPIYQEGFFHCDACGKRGNGFSYHCKACNIDLHVLCASMPLSITHQSHCHQLNLIFSPPYHNQSFSCDICKNTGSNHWLYRCNLCEFDAHLSCATTQPAIQMQRYQQAPTVPVQAPNQTPQMQYFQQAPVIPVQAFVQAPNQTLQMQQYQQAPTIPVQTLVQAPNQTLQMQQYQQATTVIPVQAPNQTLQMQHFQTISPGTQYVVRPPLQPNNLGNLGNPAIFGSANGQNNVLMNSLFSGVGQGAGQQLIQGLMGGGGSGGGGGGSGGGNIHLLQGLMGIGGGGNGNLLHAFIGGGGGDANGGPDVSGGGGGDFALDGSSLMGMNDGSNGVDLGGMGDFQDFSSY